MSFWEKIQKDIKKNIQEGLDIMKEGSVKVSKRIEKLTEEGKTKYQIFTLNMKVQDEFAKLGGRIYDVSLKSKNPMTNKRVTAIMSRIKKLEAKISVLEKKHKKKAVKKSSKKAKKKKARKTARSK